MNQNKPKRGYLSVKAPLPAVTDAEGKSVPLNLPPVIDAHVHIFPEPVYQAVWEWFSKYGWPIRYQLPSVGIIDFLLSRGIDHVVAFQYAHKPGMAGWLNDYMVKKVEQFRGRVTGMATVFPGEEGAEDIVKQAFKKGLKGIKLHMHVQCFELVSREMEILYAICSKASMPMVIHAGREPGSPAYPCDPYSICGAEKVEEVVRSYQGLRLCVPHLGMDQFDEYRTMLEKYDNLWMDTAMAITDYLPLEAMPDIKSFRLDRVMYGSDFPNIPYAWDRELKILADSGISAMESTQVLRENAIDFFSIEPHSLYKSTRYLKTHS
ncbi:putative metal-dependent hydrolase (TIM-barrel fold protein) [Desulfamplus magnetovallimortis]|uniref:Putative metal-dependent hydrolase (TIM-barrel fold protein) n=1 Tax=Desulfamplus magnetovallimortis TaxID=1246637 RepID=A0A1W1HAK0_9BACT|nr:amidohydrolase family protein [Desulfamplus magnetovallimortis]SLM29459.1 putative metal-dependent hydrolase (TIM-barrel fold protein) [Desulfamplus magnetovallimortis]